MTANSTDRRVDMQFVSFRTFSKGGKQQNCMLALIGVGTMLKIEFRHTVCNSTTCILIMIRLR